MNGSEPKLRRYQFRLRSLLQLTVFVAVLCSIGVYTHWAFAAAIVIGGIAGGLFAGTWLGVAQGAVSGTICSVVAAFIVLPSEQRFWAAAIISSLLGGILGGYSAQYHADG
jgi:uncharacterized membrane protein